MHLFDTIAYLEHGNTRQQAVYTVLNRSNIFTLLSAYTPILAGTIPIAIDIQGSDLDILCCFDNTAEFMEVLTSCFSGFDSFTIRQAEIDSIPSVIASFFIDGFEIEVFGQAVPVKEQYGYRHMVIEYQILREKGDDFRQQIIELKKQGYKTEPAFAKLLGLEGNPYQAILTCKTTAKPDNHR